MWGNVPEGEGADPAAGVMRLDDLERAQVAASAGHIRGRRPERSRPTPYESTAPPSGRLPSSTVSTRQMLHRKHRVGRAPYDTFV